jgi:AcrR family transcriptional regulator
MESTRMRADARRNREQIVATARTVFADEGPDVPMDELARLAGVGVGTLYRRFADRDAIVLAVFQDSLATVLARSRTAAAEEPSAWAGLVRSMTYSPELKLTLRLSGLLSPATAAAVRTDPVVRRIRDELDDLTESLVRAAQAEGSLRGDVGAGDVVHLFSLLLRGHHAASGELDERAFARARAITLDGLRAQPGSALPGHPLGVRDLERTDS